MSKNMSDRADALLRRWAKWDDGNRGGKVLVDTIAYLAEPPRTETLAWCIENAVPGDVLVGHDGIGARFALNMAINSNWMGGSTPWRLDIQGDPATNEYLLEVGVSWHTLRTSAGSIRIAEAEQAGHLPGVICDGPCCDEPLAVDYGGVDGHKIECANVLVPVEDCPYCSPRIEQALQEAQG